MATLEAKLKLLCEIRDWSIRQLAQNANVKESTLYSAFERSSPMNVESAIRIARVMDVEVEWLFDDDKAMADLKSRPFWLPPKIDLHREETLRALDDSLDQYVRERHGIAGAKRPHKPGGKSRAGPQATAAGRRRRSAAKEG